MCGSGTSAGAPGAPGGTPVVGAAPAPGQNPYSTAATNPFYASVISQAQAQQQPNGFNSGSPTLPSLDQLMQMFSPGGGG